MSVVFTIISVWPDCDLYAIPGLNMCDTGQVVWFNYWMVSCDKGGLMQLLSGLMSDKGISSLHAIWSLKK